MRFTRRRGLRGGIPRDSRHAGREAPVRRRCWRSGDQLTGRRGRSDQTAQPAASGGLPRAPPGGLGDGISAGQPQHADGQVSKGRHHPRSVALPDLAPVFVEGDVPDPVVALHGPVFPREPQERPRVRFLRTSSARQPVNDLFPQKASIQLRGLPLETKDDLRVGELEVAGKLVTQLNLADLDPPVAFVDGLGLREKKIPSPESRCPRAESVGCPWR